MRIRQRRLKAEDLPPLGLRIGEVARRLHLHPSTIRRLEQKGLIHCRRDWTGARRFALEELLRVEEELFKNGKVTHSSPGILER